MSRNPKTKQSVACGDTAQCTANVQTRKQASRTVVYENSNG